MSNRLQRLQLQRDVKEVAGSASYRAINGCHHRCRRVMQVPGDQKQQEKSASSAT